MVDTEKHFATRLSVIFQDFPFGLKELAVCIFDLENFKYLITHMLISYRSNGRWHNFFIPYYELKIRYSFPAVTSVSS